MVRPSRNCTAEKQRCRHFILTDVLLSSKDRDKEWFERCQQVRVQTNQAGDKFEGVGGSIVSQSRAEAKRRGIAIVPIRWAVTDKGDLHRPKVRCRLVWKRVSSENEGNLARTRTLRCDASVGKLQSVAGTSRQR